MAWTCLWDGCPDKGFRFVYVVPIFRTDVLRWETPEEANLRDAQRHHRLAHGINPDGRNTDNRGLSPTDTLD